MYNDIKVLIPIIYPNKDYAELIKCQCNDVTQYEIEDEYEKKDKFTGLPIGYKIIKKFDHKSIEKSVNVVKDYLKGYHNLQKKINNLRFHASDTKKAEQNSCELGFALLLLSKLVSPKYQYFAATGEFALDVERGKNEKGELPIKAVGGLLQKLEELKKLCETTRSEQHKIEAIFIPHDYVIYDDKKNITEPEKILTGEIRNIITYLKNSGIKVHEVSTFESAVKKLGIDKNKVMEEEFRLTGIPPITVEGKKENGFIASIYEHIKKIKPVLNRHKILVYGVILIVLIIIIYVWKQMEERNEFRKAEDIISNQKADDSDSYHMDIHKAIQNLQYGCLYLNPINSDKNKDPEEKLDKAFLQFWKLKSTPKIQASLSDTKAILKYSEWTSYYLSIYYERHGDVELENSAKRHFNLSNLSKNKKESEFTDIPFCLDINNFK